jgi:hypothetical protein
MTGKHRSTTVASQSAKTKLYSCSQYNIQLCTQSYWYISQSLVWLLLYVHQEIMWRDKTVLLNVQSPQKQIYRYRDKKKEAGWGHN